MNIIERPLLELITLPHENDNDRDTRLRAEIYATHRIIEITFDLIGIPTIEDRLFSGFEGKGVVSDSYEPIATHILEGTLNAMTAKQWEEQYDEANPGLYAYRICKGERMLHTKPAIGVYKSSQYEQGWGRFNWKTLGDLSVPDTCTDIIIWSR